MKKIVASILGLGVGMVSGLSPAVAQSEAKSVYQRIQESPFGLSLATESYANPRVEKSGETALDFNNQHRIFPQLSFKFDETTQFKLYPRIDLAKKGTSNEFKSNTGYVVLRVDKKGILTESTDGVDFSADARYYAFVNAQSREQQGAVGSFNVRTYLDKKFTEEFSLNNENRVWILNKGQATAYSTTRSFADLYVTPKYKLMGPLALDTELNYVYNVKKTNDTDVLYVAPHLVYQPSDRLTGKLGVKFEAERESDVTATGVALRDPYALDGSLAYSFTKDFSAEFFLEAPTRANTAAGADDFEFTENMKLELDLAMTFF
jgi:hypothetical protein